MAAAVQVAGACLVKTGTGSASALETVGYSVNGVDIQEDVFSGDVPGDQNGGDQGPPIEIQIFGEVHRISIDLSKYDSAVVAKIEAKINGGTTGQTTTAGTLYFAGAYYYRLLLTATNFTRNYLAAIPRQPQGLNVGSKFSVKRLVFDCHAVNGVMWNTTTSG